MPALAPAAPVPPPVQRVHYVGCTYKSHHFVALPQQTSTNAQQPLDRRRALDPQFSDKRDPNLRQYRAYPFFSSPIRMTKTRRALEASN
ncbi:hypothetical protein M404DRAFT_406492 [Pisolithus tinctorius Marx 270]|uniref:Uncharacterized protein n=1 Tax=Pisolithus tinctorius Marx 270 TaxID=870435 RepID=A0A0C3P2M4_PISTI|nr:hypothetical protein M404DRAFT_406492 [Pisolithus tinctorius Marx 270]